MSNCKACGGAGRWDDIPCLCQPIDRNVKFLNPGPKGAGQESKEKRK